MFEQLFSRLRTKRDRWQNEEEVRIGWITELSAALNIELHAERDRLDSSYNNVVIEFKDRGLFRGRETSASFREAINDRLKPYIIRTAASEHLDQSDYIGIAIDGDHIAFAQVQDGEITHGPLMPFSEASVAMVAFALKDSYRRAVSAENLIEDFGHESTCGISLMATLAASLAKAVRQRPNNKIKMLFAEWRSLFGQVADLTSEQIKQIQSALRFKVAVPAALRIPSSLFVIHTYNAIVIKLLAAEIVSSHRLTSYPNFAQQTAVLNDARLLQTLDTDIERGEFYARAGIRGFAEEAIFSWYLAAEPSDRTAILQSIRTMLVQLALYRTDRLTVARSADVVKRFYQDLVPETLRKSLGEFYTPDWLVQFTLDKAGARDWLSCRALDPTCGSGSFVLEVVRRKREAALTANWDSARTIRHLVESVWGFDLNPLAVLASRVNFLISIADLLQNAPGEQLELPILLADAIYSPARDPESDEDVVTYRIGSETADLEITLPADLAFDRQRLDKIFEGMAERVAANEEYGEATRKMVQGRALSAAEAETWQAPLRATYNRVLALHRSNWNGIWFRIVRNFFWSATAGRFDLVAGNPPWVRWSKLPELYRERVKPTCLQYKIFSSTPHHGGNELDISGMITYTVADKWLDAGGTLAFVITQTHFQSPSSEGFRRFHINTADRLLPQSVDDMKAIRPFPDAANKTAIAVFKKTTGQEPTYPVPYVVWDRRRGQSGTIPVHLTKDEALARIEGTRVEANPVSGGASPWCILPTGRFAHVNKLAGLSSWVHGRKGITADLNGVYFVEILEVSERTNRVKIATRPDAGRTDIGPRQEFWVEPTLIYPLLKGASDFSACRIHRDHSLYTFVPNTGIVRDAYTEATRQLDADLPLTKRYFATFEGHLKRRSTFKGRMKGAPYYAIYNVGDYSFAPWKVIWAEQKAFCAAVVGSAQVPIVGSRTFVPDHKIFFADFTDRATAFYLCGLLNAPIVKEFVESHNIGIQVGDIFKHMCLPKYDARNEDHVKLSRLSGEAHVARADSDYQRLLGEVRKLAEEILDYEEAPELLGTAEAL